jgi:hypothetical protein
VFYHRELTEIFRKQKGNIVNKMYHILNGDSLREQFPEELKGEILITRECLIDGDVQGSLNGDFFEIRTKFIRDCYGKDGETFYRQNIVTEFIKMRTIPEDADVNLWFEDDLFCQTNLWFVTNVLNDKPLNRIYYLIRPKDGSEYSFGGMNRSELLCSYQNRIPINTSELNLFSELWKSYQSNDCEHMQKIAGKLDSKFPFLVPAVHAHIDRIPTAENPGRIIQTLADIINDLGTTEFVPIFKEFKKRAGIYGLGDMQIRNILAKMNK